MGAIRLEKVKKTFGTLDVIPGVDLDISEGEFVVFVGPSGCGKSTLLRLIAGLEDVTDGKILINGTDVANEAPAKRGLSMVFQSYALYPHMTVYNNIAFGLKMAGESKAVIKEKVENAAKILNLTDYLERRPSALSGGQRQRVAIGRAIVRNPAAFLFDEPLSNLDAALRVNMRLEITALHQELRTTMIYVTHDQVEAMTMADKIVVLQAGRVEQVGKPMELYNNPSNKFVAGFIGSPKMNFLGGALAQAHNCHEIGIRPEHVAVSTTEGDIQATVQIAEHLGAETYLHVEAEGYGHMTVRANGEVPLGEHDKIFLTPETDRIHRFDAQGMTLDAS
ncbi:ABC transporter ATP-binding protein [Thalassospira sp. MA62]|nr:ABC transporter ATP-binding protein [Thalassospira sp. MA62]